MFKKIMLHLFWVYAPLNEEPSVIKKCLKVLEAAITFVVIVWAFVFILLLPAWFSEKHVINGHVIYSSNNVDSELLQDVLDITKEKMKKSAIDIPELLPTIYLYNHDIFYYLSMLNFSSNSTAVYDTVYKRIHVRLNEEHMYTDGIMNQDWLSTVIAGEKIHNLQHERYGILTYLFLIPKWVSKGYVQYVSYDHVPPDKDYEEWLRRVNAGESINKSFEYWVLVRHAIDQMGYSVDELHNGDADRKVVEKSLLNWVEKKLKQEVHKKSGIRSQVLFDAN